jgi:ferrous iron transport protein A
MPFSSLKIGQQAQVVSIDSAAESYRDMLYALGLVPGTLFTVTHIAPLGDPVEIIVRDTHLCLRKQEAEVIRVALVEAK